QDDLGGIVADNIGTVTITGTDGYHGRVAATGAVLGTVNVVGAPGAEFGGVITAAGDLGAFNLGKGDFAGLVSAGGNAGTITLGLGDLAESGVIEVGGSLGR